MPFDGSGAYALPVGSTAVTGATILASTHNTPIEDIAAALSQLVLRSGVAAMTGDLVMGGNKVEGLAAGTVAGDAVRFEQVGLLSAANTFTAAQTISVTAAGVALSLESTDAGAANGPSIELYRNSASPADGDIGPALLVYGKDSAGNKQLYANAYVSFTDVDSGTEDGTWNFNTTVAGADTNIFSAGSAGIVVNTGNVSVGGVNLARLNATDADALLDTLGMEEKGAITWHNGASWVVLAPPAVDGTYFLSISRVVGVLGDLTWASF